MQPLYTVGTSASLVSIKYKQDTSYSNHQQDPASIKPRRRRLFSHNSNNTTTTNNNNNNSNTINYNNHHNSNTVTMTMNHTHLLNNINESDEEQQHKTPSLSSSSSSNNHHSTSSSIPIPSNGKHNDDISTVMPTPTLSFLARSHTLGRSNSKKPKSSITKTNSSFVQKIITNDQLAKILVSRTSQDTNLFYNCGTSFIWMDGSGHPKVRKIPRIL
jgi:hypothetical protein